MKKSILLILFCTSFAWGQSYTQDVNTAVSFKIKNMGFNVSGSFDVVNIEANFDKNNLDKSFVKSHIRVKSVNTKNKKRDKHLINDDYFDTDRFEEIVLTSTRITKTAQGKFQMAANLKIKDKTKKIFIPLIIKEKNSGLVIDSTFKIDRLDYGVGKSSWVMGDIVTIKVHFVGKS